MPRGHAREGKLKSVKHNHDHIPFPFNKKDAPPQKVMEIMQTNPAVLSEGDRPAFLGQGRAECCPQL